ncbi:hypothetical protein CFOL_v3_33973 [Cephalotus follicularis]|uniref:Uncharacterized protein n=1 Tax=Cephalotus follicularis TaxID=3775 RepID=A0A1Q3DDL7_CEPFO|nr:hypothetical protein CFOL_v3_33973 [Cephalotus follicularis]
MMLLEKRHVFLRSYQFCRKRTLTRRIKRSFTISKRVIWCRIRSVRKFLKLVWSTLRFAFSSRRRRFLHLVNSNCHNHHTYTSSSCFWLD